MRELNEQELEQVAGGYYSNFGQANAGSEAHIKLGVYSSKSTADVYSGYGVTDAYAKNATFAAGFGVHVDSGASSSVGQFIG